MSIKVDMTSNDLDRQIALLKFYPEVMEKHYKAVLKQDVKALEGRIRPTIPRLTGLAQKTFGSKVTGKGIDLTGRVGWYDRSDPWYPNIVEYGARPHPLSKGVSIRTKKKFFYFTAYMSDPNRIRSEGTHVKIGNKWVTIEIHPGFSKRGFMAAGYSALKPLIDADMARASEAVVNEMAVK